jgi:hypothetical protein
MISATATTIITAATALLLQAISSYKAFRKLGKEKKRKTVETNTATAQIL